MRAFRKGENVEAYLEALTAELTQNAAFNKLLGGISTASVATYTPPKFTTTERNAIVSPAAGSVIYNTTTSKLNLYTTAWKEVTSAA